MNYGTSFLIKDNSIWSALKRNPVTRITPLMRKSIVTVVRRAILWSTLEVRLVVVVTTFGSTSSFLSLWIIITQFRWRNEWYLVSTCICVYEKSDSYTVIYVLWLRSVAIVVIIMQRVWQQVTQLWYFTSSAVISIPIPVMIRRVTVVFVPCWVWLLCCGEYIITVFFCIYICYDIDIWRMT